MPDDDVKVSELPQNVQDYIGELRKEAARYRTERNEFRDKYSSAGETLAEANQRIDSYKEFETKYNDLAPKHTSLTENYDRLRAAAKFGISEEANRLQGSNYEEWETDAESLSKKFGTGAPPGVVKDPAAKEPPQDPKDDPITEAFRKAGVL